VHDEDSTLRVAIGSSLPAGTVIGGRFRVEREIGRGGMGEVYAARHTTTLKEVALKRIRLGAVSGVESVRRFMLEARAATAIRHPNVVEVYDVFVDADGSPIMVMELLEGESFASYRARAGALTLGDAATVLLPAARALKAAHEKGIVHRDLKPDNVFLAQTSSGRATKVLDFGIAKVLDPAKIGSDTQAAGTITGSILGTPSYMSYEQAMSDKNIDQRSDVWSFGVMLFEALTGRRPLEFDTLGGMYTKFLKEPVPSIRAVLPELPLDAGTVIDQCLAKFKADRLGDLGPLIDVLVKYTAKSVPGAESGGRVIDLPFQEQVPSSVVTGSTEPRGRRKSSAALGTVIVATALALGVWALWLRPRGTPAGPALPEAPVAATAQRMAPSVPSVIEKLPTTAETPVPSSAPAPRPARSVTATRANHAVEVPAQPGSADAKVSAAQDKRKKGISDALPY
jgi:serine/threonine-protein kinase